MRPHQFSLALIRGRRQTGLTLLRLMLLLGSIGIVLTVAATLFLKH
jgi:hypothetical protein